MSWSFSGARRARPTRWRKQFKYAESIGVRVAALVGEDEARAGTVTLKDLKNRAQVTVPRAEAPAEIRRLLN